MTLVALLAAITGAAAGELVSEEIRGRLDHLPRRLLRLAARRLPPSLREDLLDEWDAELHEILRGVEALPVTRLIRGARFALGLFRAGPRIGRELGRYSQPEEDKSRAGTTEDRIVIVATTPMLTRGISDEDKLWQAFTKLDSGGRDLLRAVAVAPSTPYSVIAEHMGMPVSEISSMRARYLAQLRQLLAEAEEVDPDCQPKVTVQ